MLAGNRKLFTLFIIISITVIFLSRCIGKDEKFNPRGNGYAGSESCKKCHQSVYNTYINTLHYKASQQAAKGNIKGSFGHGQNIFSFDEHTKVSMQEKDNGFFQVLYVNGKEKEAHKFDLTFGVKNAQTFLYWDHNKPFELPISYYSSINGWATSPGFSAQQVNFKRFIGKNCFECHSTFIDSKLTASSEGMDETLDKNTLITGIDCERCHGPAKEHVDFQLTNPDIKQAKYIVSYKSLSRQQQLDACAVCHSGNDREEAVSTFKFKMRDTLANFFLPSGPHFDNSPLDVHGNQYHLLASSKCFIKSKTLTCITCHNPHEDAGSNMKTYSEKCISCHNNVHSTGIKNETLTVNAIQSNCIDCHMPKLPSKAITFSVSGNKQPGSYLLRTHKIAVYTKPDKSLQTFIHFYKKIKTCNGNPDKVLS